jgi:acylphosphatase
MIGIRHDNSQIETYEKALENGQVLVMVDVASERVDEIERVIQDAAPGTKVEGTDAHKSDADT